MFKKLDKYREKSEKDFERVLFQISREFYMLPEGSFEFIALKPFYLTIVQHLYEYNSNAWKSLSVRKIKMYTEKINMTYKRWYLIYNHIKTAERIKS